MSAERDGPGYLRPYLDAVRAHGAGFRATLWGTEEAQHLRFDVMIDLVPLAGTTVVDVGCGDGALAVHLRARGVDLRGYVGLDAVPEMIDLARKRVGESAPGGADAPVASASAKSGCRFEVADVLADPQALAVPEADWMLFSGSLNTLDQSAAWTVIDRALSHAAAGVVFNFLSDRCHERWRDRVLAPARRFDTLAMIDLAFARSSRVLFRQDYLDGHDATIAIVHDA